VVGLDRQPKQLFGATSVRVSAHSGQVLRSDHACERHGTAHDFMMILGQDLN
jgi:hypothetical protein